MASGLITVELPILHPGQVEAYKIVRKNKRTAIRCGRRWGKTDFGKVLGGDYAIRGKNVCWAAPDYKIQSEAFAELSTMLDPIKKNSSKIDGLIRTTTGGRIDFWTLDNERAGRSRKYDLMLIDEAAFTKANMAQIWELALEPTLLDTGGKCVVMSNTNGISPDNFLYQICAPEEKRAMGVPSTNKFGFAEYHAPTMQNPHIPNRELGESDVEWQARRLDVFAKLKATKPLLVWQQEYLAEFVDWSGDAFFSKDKLLVDGKPVPYPHTCGGVYATIDTAVKTNTEHDATAVTFWSIDEQVGHRLIVLDWEIVQIQGSLLEVWLPSIFRRLEELAIQLHARSGSLGAWIEDKVSGTILLQQAAHHSPPWPAHAIDSKLTSVGKDERAINVSGYVHQGLVKISEYAFEKTMTLKEVTRNHFISQVMGFHIGAKDGQADDLLDTFTYGIAIGLGNPEGY